MEERINGPVAQVTFSEMQKFLSKRPYLNEEHSLNTSRTTYRQVKPPLEDERVEIEVSPISAECEHYYGETKVEKVAEDIPVHVDHSHRFGELEDEDIIREDPPTNSGKEIEDEGRSL